MLDRTLTAQRYKYFFDIQTSKKTESVFLRDSALLQCGLARRAFQDTSDSNLSHARDAHITHGNLSHARAAHIRI